MTKSLFQRILAEVFSIHTHLIPSSPEVESTKDEQAREGKFLMYWMTTTSTSTTYTTTTTISSLACTPSGFTISNCTG